MSKPGATYCDLGRMFHADTCENIIRSMQAGKVRMEALSRRQYPGRRLPRDILPGLATVGFWDAEQQQNWGTGWHYNEGLEVGFLETGRLTFSLPEATYVLSPGDVSFTRPWLHHNLGDPHVGAARAYWLVLDVGIRRPGQAWRWPWWIVLTKAERQELAVLSETAGAHVWRADVRSQQCFQQVGRLVQTDRVAGNASRLAILINELLVGLLEALRERRPDASERPDLRQADVRRFWKSLCGNPGALANAWTVEDMARECRLGVDQFVHATKRLTNVSPSHYLQHCRLSLAARLLLERRDRNITEIALEAGFSSGQYFAKLFQQHFGCTPSIYRNLDPSDRLPLPQLSPDTEP